MNAIEKKVKSESGAATIIEMTLIFPLVVLIMAFLIYFGMYILQCVMVYNDAQIIAMAAAREVQMPGYTELYGDGGISALTDFDWPEGSVPGKETVNDLYKQHDPYRYWNFSTDGLISGDAKSTLKDALNTLCTRNAFLLGTDFTCEIHTNNIALAQYVTVHITQKTQLPALFQTLGLDSLWTIDIEARATVSDSSEFIRNTDMVFDLGSYLWDNLKFGKNNQTMSERVTIFSQKIKDAKAKLGW